MKPCCEVSHRENSDNNQYCVSGLTSQKKFENFDIHLSTRMTINEAGQLGATGPEEVEEYHDHDGVEDASVMGLVETYERFQTPRLETTLLQKVTFADKDQMVFTSMDGENTVDDDLISTPSKASRPTRTSPVNIAQRKKAREDDTYAGPLLTISPAEEMEFIVTDNARDTFDVLSLINTTEKYVAFKVKTTSPEKYRVRPSTGIIRPGQSSDVSVYLHPGNHEGVPKDKFLIMYMEVAADTPVLQVTEIFKTVARDQYFEHRLRCRLGSVKQTVEELPAEVPTSLQDQIHKLSQQMETLVAANTRLQRQVAHIHAFTMIFMLVLLLFTVAAVLSYWLDYLPINKYTVNSCLPMHFQ